MLKPLPGETENRQGRDRCTDVPRRGTGCGDATTSGEAKRHGRTKLYKGEQLFKPLPTKAVLPSWQHLKTQMQKASRLSARIEKLIWS